MIIIIIMIILTVVVVVTGAEDDVECFGVRECGATLYVATEGPAGCPGALQVISGQGAHCH